MAKILAIDDDKYFLISLNNFLTYKKHVVTTMLNPYNAEEIIQNENFDCILLDIQIPGISGLDLLKRIRDNSPDLPVIVISGLSFPNINETLFKFGASAYVEKPFDPMRLLKIIDDLTSRP